MLFLDWQDKLTTAICEIGKLKPLWKNTFMIKKILSISRIVFPQPCLVFLGIVDVVGQQRDYQRQMCRSVKTLSFSPQPVFTCQHSASQEACKEVNVISMPLQQQGRPLANMVKCFHLNTQDATSTAKRSLVVLN